MQSWSELAAEKIAKSRKMPWYWLLYFKSAHKLLKLIPGDWRIWGIISGYSFQKMLDLNEEGYY